MQGLFGPHQHVTIAILAEGRTSVAVLAPAGLACVLFVYEAVSVFRPPSTFEPALVSRCVLGLYAHLLRHADSSSSFDTSNSPSSWDRYKPPKTCVLRLHPNLRHLPLNLNRKVRVQRCLKGRSSLRTAIRTLLAFRHRL